MALLCCVITVAAFGQGNITNGSINGHITDSSGAALPGVTVTAANAETGLNRAVVTGSDGEYRFNLLPPGKYHVDAELAGLGKASLSAVVVLLGNDTRADLKIAPQVTESITVSAVAPVIDTQRTGMAASVTNQQIQNLPLLGRDFRSLAALTPGISTASFDGSITANGARPLSTDYNIDGASSNNDFFGQQTGGSRPPFTFSQAAIKEFQVIRTQYDAEFGRGVGAVVNAITKSGTNDLDGELFYYSRKKSWADTRPLTVNRTINGTNYPLSISDSFLAIDVNQPGFDVGGPLVRDKLFYFVNADGMKRTQPVLFGSASDLRTSAQFTALTAAQQAAVLSKIQTAVGQPYESGLSYDIGNKLNTYLVKLDGTVGSNTHLSLRDNITKYDTTDSGSTTTFGLNQTNEVDKFYQIALEGDTVINNNLFNQFIGQVGRDQRPVTAANTGTEFSINFGGSAAQFFGAADTTPNTADEKKYQIKETLNYQWRGQSLKAGFELLHRNLFDSFPRFAGGMYAFNNLTNFLNNVPNSFQQAYGPQNGDVAWNTNLWGYYANDSFHVGPRLTIDAGVRYDLEKTPRPPSNAFPQHPEFLTQIKDDKNNIGPRLSFAYDVFGNGRSVLRGGTGKFFEYMPDILLASPIQGISGALLTTTFTCTPATNCPTYPNIFSPTDFLAKSKLSANLVTIGSNYQAQEAQRSSLQFEQQLGQTYSAGISGVYSKLTHVQGTKNINLVPTGVVLGNMPVYDYNSATNAARPYKDLGIIREITSNEQAWYRAATLEFHKLAINDSKLSWDLSYTRSASIDDETNTRSTSTTFLIDPNNPSLSEGPGDNDVKHRWVGDVVYRLPWGVQISAVGFWHSGFPYTAAISFTCSGCTANSLTGQAQTSVAANFTPVFVNSSGQIIDITQGTGMTKAQFAAFLSGQGARLISRNSFRMPSVYDGDLRLTKTFNLMRGTQLQLIGEMFNVLNKNIYSVPGVNQDQFRVTYTASTDKYTITKFTNNVSPVGTAANQQNTFGIAQAYSNEVSPRQMQVAVKFIF
jgi:hypothetical protein